MPSVSRAPTTLNQLHDRASEPSRAVCEALKKTEGDILVLGAGGKMGFHLSAMLHRALAELKTDRRVIAVSRFSSPDSKRPFEQYGVSTVSCDLTLEHELQQLPDCGCLFFMAGVKFGAGDDPDLLHKMNVQLPARVASRFESSRIVALSTGCVYRYVTPESGGSVEEDLPQPVGAYAASCLGREQAFAESGARCCLVRLNYSVDLRYGVLVDIARRVLREEPVDVTMGYVNAIWQGDAISHIIQALPLAVAPARCLNVTGPEILSVRKAALRFGELFGKTVRLTGTEAPTAWLNNASLSHRMFGKPQITEDTLMEWVAAWLNQGLPTIDKPTHFEVRDGRF